MPSNSHIWSLLSQEHVRQLSIFTTKKSSLIWLQIRFPSCEITQHNTWLFLRPNRMENCVCSPSAFKKRVVIPMDTCAGLQLNYRCAASRATGGRRLEAGHVTSLLLMKTAHKEGIFAPYVSQILACIIWSQTNPTKPTHSMLLTAHFILIYILRSPPTHGQYVLTLKDDPTAFIKSMPVQTQLFSFNAEQHLQNSWQIMSLWVLKVKPLHISPLPAPNIIHSTAPQCTGTFQRNDVSTNDFLLVALNPHKVRFIYAVPMGGREKNATAALPLLEVQQTLYSLWTLLLY